MAKPLSVGDTVQCRFFNTPDGRFYGPYFVGKITKINQTNDHPYFVESESRPLGVWLHRKEIKRRIKS